MDLGIVSKMPEYKILLQNYPSGRKDLSCIQILTRFPALWVMLSITAF